MRQTCSKCKTLLRSSWWQKESTASPTGPSHTNQQNKRESPRLHWWKNQGGWKRLISIISKDPFLVWLPQASLSRGTLTRLGLLSSMRVHCRPQHLLASWMWWDRSFSWQWDSTRTAGSCWVCPPIAGAHFSQLWWQMSLQTFSSPASRVATRKYKH